MGEEVAEESVHRGADVGRSHADGWGEAPRPSRTDRRASEITSSIRPTRRLTAVATSRTSGGPAGVARAVRSPLPSRCAVAARSVTSRVPSAASSTVGLAPDDSSGRSGGGHGSDG